GLAVGAVAGRAAFAVGVLEGGRLGCGGRVHQTRRRGLGDGRDLRGAGGRELAGRLGGHGRGEEGGEDDQHRNTKLHESLQSSVEMENVLAEAPQTGGLRGYRDVSAERRTALVRTSPPFALGWT